MTEARWLLPAGSGEEAASLARALGIGLPAARILSARGFGDPDAARRFLRPSLDGLHDPRLLRGLPEAVERLRRAIERREKILIYGDYDVDGTTAVVVLKTAIRLADGDAYGPASRRNRLKRLEGKREENEEKREHPGHASDTEHGGCPSTRKGATEN